MYVYYNTELRGFVICAVNSNRAPEKYTGSAEYFFFFNQTVITALTLLFYHFCFLK